MIRSSTGLKHQRLAKITLYRKVECLPRVSNISAAGLVMCILKGLSTTLRQAVAKVVMGVFTGGAEA